MGWTKGKTARGAIILLLAGTAAVMFNDAVLRPQSARRQVLADGSVLALNQVQVNSKPTFVHGSAIEKLFGNLIPTNGVHLLNVNLNRPTRLKIDSFGKSWLVAEFRLAGPNAANHPLVKPAFFRQFRIVVYGDSGIEFVQDLWGRSSGGFESYSDGYYGYIVTSRFPRDSRRLGFRFEKRQTASQGGPWETVADLKTANPARPSIQPWVADSSPATKSVAGLDLTLKQVTVKMIPYMSNDIWNHVVTAAMEVRSNGVLLTNWSAPYGDVQAEDASGNWDLLAGHRSLDPKYVWKLETDFEPVSDFSVQNLATIILPGLGTSTITTNVMNVPVTISWDGQVIDASIPTNHSNLALRFVSAVNDEDENIKDTFASGGKYNFRVGGFATLRSNVLALGAKPTKVAVAVVPTIHATFYVQPQMEGKSPNK